MIITTCRFDEQNKLEYLLNGQMRRQIARYHTSFSILFINLKRMSKWNKQQNQPSQEFLQNEQRRKQMIIEAARRRKEKEKKQLEQQELQRKNNEQALTKHKQQKKDAYIRYLRNNMHDKYEEARRKQKQEEEEIKPRGKWKRKSAEKDQGQQLQALDLEVRFQESNSQDNSRKKEKADVEWQKEKDNSNYHTQQQQNQSAKAEHQKIVAEFKRQWMADSFEKEWQGNNDQLLSSQLLDSLDLDIGTMQRDREVKKLMRPTKKEPKKQQVLELRELIGYESVVMNSNGQKIGEEKGAKGKQQALEERKIDLQAKANTKDTKKIPGNRAIKPQINEVQAFNELKRKKEAKIMNWAIEEQQEAEDLFSNCSTRKSAKALKELNEELKQVKNKPNLPTITEEQTASSGQLKPRGPAGQNPFLKERIASRGSRQKQDRKESSVSKPQKIVQKSADLTQQEKPKTASGKPNQSASVKQPPKTVSNFGSEKNLIRTRTTSRQTKQNSRQNDKKQAALSTAQQRYNNSREKYKQASFSKPQPKAQNQPKRQGKYLPPLPGNRTEYDNSIATYDMQIDIESFIKQDLMNLNENQRKLQEELRQLHQNNKDTIKDVYGKYNIKTDYRHSKQIEGEGNELEESYGYRLPNEHQIQESLQNLDHMLIRKELVSREKVIREKTEEESNHSKSFINPFSQSEDLCQQVLQLAKNVSRFQAAPQTPVPDGYLSKAKKLSFEKNQAKTEQQMSKVDSNYGGSRQEEIGQSVCESEEVSRVALGHPPVIEKEEKIHVNAKLLKGLLLDDE